MSVCVCVCLCVCVCVCVSTKSKSDVHTCVVSWSQARPDGALKVTSLDIQYAGVEELPGGDRLAFHATNIATGQHVWLLPAANAKAYDDAPARGGDATAPAGFTELVAPAEIRKLVLHPVLVCPSSLVEEGDRFDQMIEFPAAADTACIAAGAAPVSPQLALVRHCHFPAASCVRGGSDTCMCVRHGRVLPALREPAVVCTGVPTRARHDPRRCVAVERPVR